MKKFSFKAFLCLFVMLLMACTSDPVSTELSTDYESSIGKSPDLLKGKKKDGEFASPLFDLGTAPNGDILVADAGAGISNIYGFTEISLPGVTSVGPIGRGSMWATTGPLTIGEEDSGQAIYRVTKGKNRLIANLFDYEAAKNPDGKEINSNPYSVASLGGNSALVVDSGGNDLLRINNQGNIELVAVFPDELVSTTNFQQLTGCPALIALLPCCQHRLYLLP